MQVSPSLSHFFSRQQQLYTDLTRYVPTQYRYTRWQHIYLTYLGTLSPRYLETLGPTLILYVSFQISGRQCMSWLNKCNIFFNRTISNFDIYIEIFDTIRYQCRYRNDFDTISTLISIFRCKYRNLYRNSMLFVKKARFFDKNIKKSRFSIKISKNLVFRYDSI